MSKTTTFRYDSETEKHLKYLVEHMQKYSLGSVSRADIIRLALKEMYEKYN